MITFSKKIHLGLQIALVIVLGINFQTLHWPLLGLLFGFLYLFINSKKLGDIFFERSRASFKNILGLLTILIYLSLLYTAVYHLWQINDYIFWLSLISIPLVVEILSCTLNKQHIFFTELDIPNIRLANIRNLLIPLIFLIIEILTFVLLFRRASVDILRSPWEILDAKFWTLLIISTILLIIFAIQNKKANKPLWLISIHLLLISSVALIVYPLGFGYDPFIHQATMKIIADTGTVTPRLFLYLGQYGWTFFFSSLFQLTLPIMNKLLLPLSFGLLWTYTLYYGLRYGLKWSRKFSLISIFLSLFVGFNFAIMTTPQNLAFLLTAIFIFLLPVIKKYKISLYFILALALATLTIHPLAGIPLLYFSSLLAVQNLPGKKIIKQTIYIFGLIISSLILPIFLALYQKINGRDWSQIFTFHFWPLFELPKLKFYSQYSFVLDWLHNIWANQIWIYLGLVIIGLILIIKNNKLLFFKKHLTFFCLLLANYLLTKIFISFDVQINYEQNAYLTRIAYLMCLVVLPIFLTTFYFWWHKYVETRRFSWNKTWLTVITTLIVIVSVYFSYPIYDRHLNSKSFNLTTTDLETVYLIDRSANQQPYIVLANQMVGVAAISTFGFAHYYPIEINANFYYSMPLGVNNIYQNYLYMIEKQASREQALAAMDKAQVDKLYFVVNNYWHSAKTAIIQAQQSADDYFTVANGKSYVFIYNR